MSYQKIKNKILIVVPTFNERENIVDLITRITELYPDIHIMVVDDNSPDGTSDVLLPYLSDRIFLFNRKQGKAGRGSAVKKGFEWGLNSTNNYLYFIEMDADFSHSPEALINGIKILYSAKADVPVLVIGSRYCPYGRIYGRPFLFRLLSYTANKIERFILGNYAADYTSGFRFYNRRAIEILLKTPQINTGYIYLAETICFLALKDAIFYEFPIVYENRLKGKSKLSLKEVWLAMKGLIKISLKYHIRLRENNSL